MAPPEESRVAVRKVLRCRAKVIVQGGRALSARTVDLSISGLSVMVEEAVPSGQSCMIMFETPVRGNLKQVNAVAKAVYSICGSEGFRIGFQFVQLSAVNIATINEIVSG